MSKFYGKIGYFTNTETTPGVWNPKITEREYVGDLIQNTHRTSSADKTNDDIDVSNKISIISDPYAQLNFHAIKYVEFMGTKWKITNVEVRYPRLILTMGGVYNGQQT